MRKNWEVAGLLLWLLACKTTGRKKGDLDDARMIPSCYQPFPMSFVNCSWVTWESPNVNTTYILHHQSLKLGRVLLDLGKVHSVVAQTGQNWLLIDQRNLNLGDMYSVWVEARTAARTVISKRLNFTLDEIAKPSPPELDLVEADSFGAQVTWKNLNWSDFHSDQPLLCAIQYKASTDRNKTHMHEGNIDQDSYDLDNLKPFTCYEVQVRCLPGNRKGFWSEWSSPKTFHTLEADPLGHVDVWQKECISDHHNRSCFLLWKPLDPEAARGKILDYEIIIQDQNKTLHRMSCNCCEARIQPTAQYASIAARNSVKATLLANLSLEKAELPGPEGVQVMPMNDLGLNVTWKPSVDPRWFQPQEYVVEWRKEMVDDEGVLLNWTRTPGSRNSALLRDNFSSEVPYCVHVHALYAHWRTASNPVRVYFREGAPSAGPQILQDRSLSSTTSLISWEEIPLADRKGHIIYYTLYLKHLNSGNLTKYPPINATERSYTLSDLEPGATYQLWMTGSTSAGESVPSPLHQFSTSVSHWPIITTSLGVILPLMGSLLVLLKYRWLLGFCCKVLPRWCWEKIPDPRHSGVVKEMNEQNTASDLDALAKSSAKFEEVMDIIEIQDPIPEPTPQLTTLPASVEISGYEKRFLPTQEEILNFIEQERNRSSFCEH